MREGERFNRGRERRWGEDTGSRQRREEEGKRREKKNIKI